MSHISIFLIGILIGFIISNLIWTVSSTYGKLKIDKSNPEKDLYSLEIKNLDVIEKKKIIIFKVEK